MKFMIMMNAGPGPYKISSWPEQDIKTHIAYMQKINEDLMERGEFVGGEGLAGPDQAKLIRADQDGLPVTDGVFPETKEFLAGFWIVDVETPERAYEIAAEASMAPGVEGKPMRMAMEVRQVLCPPEENRELGCAGA